ncbi:hypothetical protein M378DRAFT_165387 [Amanita muscaria Koide BX008]|uniref:Uncharacterized protein n=1 Tax=Amanita muscaria (strain Koide BX008) TaxID=946122 RepID=A0A0C2SHT4_AMAMK|nr:hypothetical protein M378DRAFT_165387 [Amanita muscaria Koide BX008]
MTPAAAKRLAFPSPGDSAYTKPKLHAEEVYDPTCAVLHRGWLVTVLSLVLSSASFPHQANIMHTLPESLSLHIAIQMIPTHMVEQGSPKCQITPLKY